jgi:hypothetical protein
VLILERVQKLVCERYLLEAAIWCLARHDHEPLRALVVEAENLLALDRAQIAIEAGGGVEQAE